MNYYKVTLTTDFNIVGAYPQIDDLIIGYEEAQASRFSTIKNWKKDEDIVAFQNFKANNDAIITDVWSSNFFSLTNGCIISNKLFAILQKMNCYKLSNNVASVYYKGNPLQNNIIWYPNGHELVEYQKSTFEVIDLLQEEAPEKISIFNFNDFGKKNVDVFESTGRKKIEAKEIILSEAFDFVSLSGIVSYVICSEHFKNTIENSNITGFKFSKPPHTIR